MLTIKLPPNVVYALDTNTDTLVLRLNTIHGRMAARAFAYSIEATDPKGAKEVLDIIGREG